VIDQARFRVASMRHASAAGWGFPLALKPDLQFIRDPGGELAADDAWVAGLRLEWTL
jgi:carbohydrate-selective porin OprB